MRFDGDDDRFVQIVPLLPLQSALYPRLPRPENAGSVRPGAYGDASRCRARTIGVGCEEKTTMPEEDDNARLRRHEPYRPEPRRLEPGRLGGQRAVRNRPR